MPKKTAQTLTRVYELVVTFTARDQRLFWHVEEKDRVRLLKVFDDRTEHRLYELGGSEGLECLVNTAHIRRINVLDYVGGIEFEAETELTEKESLKKLQERETSDEPVIVRLWLRGEKEPVVHQEIEYAEWCLARTCLIEREKFIQLDDEDGEEVLYGTDHINAIEMIDPFYLEENQVEKLLGRYDQAEGADDTAPTESPAPAAPPS